MLLKFSIIIVSYNTKQLLIDCLQSLFKHCSCDLFEIIVVDNNSSDDSVTSLQKMFGDKIKIIINQNNLGFGQANNLGVKIAQGEYLFFLNSDTLIIDDILSSLFAIMQGNPQLGIISPRLLLSDGQNQPYAFGNFKWWLAKGLKLIDNNRNIKETVDYQSVGWVSGAALIIRHGLFLKLQGYDPEFFMYYEDMDLCYRAQQLGYEVAICSKIKLIHLGGRSTSLGKRKKYYYQSQTYFYYKHCGWLIANILRIIRLPKVFYYYWRK